MSDDVKVWKRIMWIQIFAASCFIIMLVLQFGVFMYAKGKADKVTVDLSDVYVPPIEIRDDPDEEGYKVLDIADNSQVLIEGHFNSVTNKQVMDYLIERQDEIPKGESVILHVRRGRIIRWEIPKEEAL
jgi:hypothetical protein